MWIVVISLDWRIYIGVNTFPIRPFSGLILGLLPANGRWPYFVTTSLIGCSGLILGLHPANERRCYYAKTSLFGCSQAQNQPCFLFTLCHQSVCPFRSFFHQFQLQLITNTDQFWDGPLCAVLYSWIDWGSLTESWTKSKIRIGFIFINAQWCK